MVENCWLKDRCMKALTGCPEFCVKYYKLNKLYEKSLLTDSQRNHVQLRPDADGTDRAEFRVLKDIENNIDSFVNNGCNLYIHSSFCGNGKSSWSVRLIQAYLNNIWHYADLECKALFVHVPKFLIALKDNISEKSDYVNYIKKNILQADLVVWDEVGTKVATPFETEQLLSLINSRLDLGKSNIYTSNLTGEELRDKVGDRLYSRICNGSTDIELHGQDKRCYRV